MKTARIITKIDRKKIRDDTGYSFMYHVFQHCPQLLEITDTNQPNDRYQTEFKDDLWKAESDILYQPCPDARNVDPAFVIISQKQLVQGWKPGKKWHETSKVISETLPPTLLDYITFGEFNADDEALFAMFPRSLCEDFFMILSPGIIKHLGHYAHSYKIEDLTCELENTYFIM